MNMDKIYSFYKSHKGEVNGAIIGFLIAVSILIIGVLKFIFIVICMAVGYYIGKVLSVDKDYLRKFLDKIFPPGTLR
ncbi:DUF2273 domain-containing protein [Pseudobacteroides cellulosolvens]|uniref:Small integral membrane protein n=1 Tax=Pseudobacteroides cellulosolvens ATCC 35603 = DSM 2933 TaxID=398512 RepID=A0A0L6JM03_9FIRM|nr:DUF2273 domain-containing protein [Pseudobacteroides cellulosolvens]KNY26770.1 Protein of unknown function DUF2273 [Pseudobacteroides cellulosolvens ATCC 35603 = DSM 2933]